MIDGQNYELYCGDCLEVMKEISDHSIDAIIADLPYGTTECKWDSIISLDKLWIEYRRVLVKNGTVVLFSSQPFTSLLVVSNLDWFKYEWIIKKERPSGQMNAKARPLKSHTNVIVFSQGAATSTSLTMIYNPQGLVACNVERVNRDFEYLGKRKSRQEGTTFTQKHTNYPQSILKSKNNKNKSFHGTEKQLDILQYFVLTYTNENDFVLDNCMGSGNTGIACGLNNRNFIGIDINQEYVDIAMARIKDAYEKPKQLELF